MPIPSDDQKRWIQVHDRVELEIEPAGLMVTLSGETITVRVTVVDGNSYSGVVVHQPEFAEGHGVREGARIKFEARHILGILLLKKEMIEPALFSKFDANVVVRGDLHCMLNERTFFVVSFGDDYLGVHIELKVLDAEFDPLAMRRFIEAGSRLSFRASATAWIDELPSTKENTLTLDFPVEHGATGEEIVAIVQWAIQSVECEGLKAEQQ